MHEATPHHPNTGQQVPHAVVVAGGDELPLEAGEIIDASTLVIAADSGLDRLLALGRLPHLIVGDLDSVSSEGLAAAHHRGIPVDLYSADKDATDTELALLTALERGVDSITLLTGGGDRLDHVWGWLNALAQPRLAAARRLDAWCATTHVQVLHGPRHHRWQEAELEAVVSLLPLAGPCHGVTTSGLRWALANATLTATSTRGVSNTTTDRHVAVGLTTGVLAVVRPHRRVHSPFTLGDHHDQ